MSFLGATIAFRLNEDKEKKANEEKQIQAINSALLIMIRQHNALNLLKKYLESFPNDNQAAFNMPALQPPSYNDLIQDVSSLEFLINSNNLGDEIMRLYIAEKPSMGAEIAKCLTGPVQRKDGYLITKDGIVTWAFGHILRQAEPEEYNAKYKNWKAEDLPIIPKQWKMIIDESCKKQFGIIKNLIDKADEIVHAGDPDREGQLLIDEVLDYLNCQKPVKRILLNALDEESIKKANKDLRDNRDFLNLKKSALARARADWLIGMNLSRAYTLAARRAGKKGVFAVGRVKTPTLALVVRRERELKDFKPVDYFTIKAIFANENGEFSATWKPKDTQAGLDFENRLIDENIAKALIGKFAQKTEAGKITAYQKAQKKEAQRLPFSLSSLQVLAGKKYGYDPQLVLDTAQKLYEKKLTTYPRSDCEYLPQSQFSDAKIILQNLLQSSATVIFIAHNLTPEMHKLFDRELKLTKA